VVLVDIGVVVLAAGALPCCPVERNS
jgi:hypothetical protein